MSANFPSHQAERLSELRRMQQQEEFRRALRALLMTPLMSPEHADFPAVRRQAERLREWFAREVAWPLHVEREGARLFKRPADLDDPTRGLPAYDRRRYVLLALACAVLERSDPQITLRLIGERVVHHAADPTLADLGFSFTLRSASERRELVTVCRTLLEQGVLERVAGEEDNFVRDSGWQQSDALYDVNRRLLAGLLAAVRGPSTWPTEEAPADFRARLQALVAEYLPDSEQGRRDAIRHRLARRLLDDPVVYFDDLNDEELAYFINQRGVMANRLCEATGLKPEQRAEGLALVDEAGQLSDVAMPSEGTDAHVTLLVAEHLAQRLRQSPASITVSEDEIVLFLRDAAGRFGRYWRKSARAPGAERELADIALDRLYRLRLIKRDAARIIPLPALARFSLGAADVRGASPSSSVLGVPE